MSQLTRTFMCVTFPDDVIKEIARIQELVLKKKFTGKVTELENLHLTLKFLGEINEETLKKIEQTLNEIKLKPFQAKLGTIGTFSHHKQPRIVWVKVDGKGMYELQRAIDNALVKIDVAPEVRFMSHLTLARIKYIKDAQELYDHLKTIKAKPIRFEIQEFKLMKSELNNMGPRYTELKTYKLNG
jgi:RNA 2',3'-cyclic 3'-phosphodiesterase